MLSVAPAAFAQGDTQPPTVVGLSPLPGAISQSVTARVTATFSEAIQPATVVFVLKDSGNVTVPASVSYDSSSHIVTLSPSSDLIPARTYTATVSGAMDLAGNVQASPSVWSFSTGQPGFQESVVFSGLQSPTAFQFASDGRVFVAQKNGLVLVFSNLTTNASTVFADLRASVDSSGNRGLLGLALDPGFPATPYVYAFYTYTSGTGTAKARISRLQASGSVMTGTEQVLVDDWYQQYSTQPVGNLAFGPDGSLYASAGDGASSSFVDSGQTDSASPDPPNEGGALRSQDLRTPGDPVTLDGSVIRIQPSTGQAVRETTSMIVGTPTVDGNGVKYYPVTSVYQGSQSQTVRVLEPTNPAPGKPHRLLYVLPVETGLTSRSSMFGDGLEELRLLNVPNRFNLTLIAPSFNYEPWYGDNATDTTLWMETFIIRELIPWGDSFLPAGTTPQRLLIGFSKSGNGALFLTLRHPNVFSEVAAWDSPAQLNNINASGVSTPGALPMNFGTQANYNLYFIPTLVTTDGQPFKSSTRIWISGDNAAWTADMNQLHSQLTAAGIPHTWVAGATRVHSWSSGWLDGAVTSLDANSAQVAPLDANEPRIIAYGLRSPRIAFRPGTQEIWAADKGWNSAEEINRIPNSTNGIVENFGWPCYEGTATTTYSSASICSLIYSQTAQTNSPFFSYLHQQKVATGDEAGVGSGSISGLRFYGSGSYPSNYHNALFFSDNVRNNIWAMFPDTNGVPNPANINNFLLGASSPVDLETGPGGDLFYADLNGGTIRRIQFVEPVGRSGGQPTGVLLAGTTQTVISLVTDQNATCRYSTTSGVSYSSMTNIFTTTGGTAQSTTVTGLVNGGSYNFFVRCSNATGGTNPDDYAISFSIGLPPSITSANSTSFSVLTPGSFQVTTTGTPASTLTETGALPSGVTFVNNGNGTATLSGPPAAGTAGTYPIVITANNGGGTPATQNFTLTVTGGSGGSANFAYVTGSVTGTFTFTGSSTTLAAALHQTPGAGHLLVCAATWQSATATASMADPSNGTWTPLGTATSGVGSLTGYRGQMFYVPAVVAAPTTVTLTISSAVGFRAFECGEYSYSGSVAALDGTPKYSTTPATGGVATVSGLVTGNLSDLVFAGCLAVDSTCSVGTGFTGLNDGTFASSTGQLIEYKVGAGPGAQNATFKTGSTDNVILGVVGLTATPSQVAPAITSASSAAFTVGTAGTFTVTATGTPVPSLAQTGALPNGVAFVSNGNGTATLSGTPAAGTAGIYPLTLTASNGVGTAATQSFTLTVNQGAAITSANSTTFTVGTAGTFTVTATGTPVPALTETGTLPNGVTFVNNGNGTATLAGTPTAGGTFSLTLTANNGVGAAANQTFTLTVNQAPAVTSANNTAFAVGTAGSFTVTVTGTPNPALTETGPLPSGVTFVDNGNRTATLSGTPSAGMAGSYPITISASNGVGTAATQSFTLTVNQAAAITSANSATFTVGTAGTFTVTATGTPVPSLTQTGALPNGVTFVNNGNGTATLAGTPTAGGTFSLTLTANNGVGTAANQTFTLTVNQAPAVSSANNAAFVVGTAGSFTVTATGTPIPALTETGPLPSGVTFVDNGNRTATLSGPPAAGMAGSYPITITASNGVGTAATQTFTLTVNQTSVITSANNATFTAGTAGTFTVTATGSPLPSLTQTGALPGGVTFVNNGNGTATLAGTPAAGGTFSLTLTASNGVGAAANQTFTLTVNQTPTITSANNATLTIGAFGSFTVTATGPPAPAITETDPLPSGVTFVNNGNGTATLSGTPAAGTGGAYPITITASNGVGTAATQNFTLTISTAQTPPVITSASTTTFTVGSTGSFSVTSTGTPTPALSETGALPNGVTFVNNGNGTATLSGPTTAGTAGSYLITISASNGVGTAATQNFTLIVNQAPAITSANSTALTVGTAGSFTVTATGAPAPALTETGGLPSGVTFVNNGNGTATLSGTPAAGTGGTYALTFTASNGVGTAATQSFTLTVNQVSAITSGAATTFVVGSAGSFTVTSTGTPIPTLTETGALPTGVTFVNNGNRTATLSGTPAAGTGGTYAITIMASNGVGTAATQSFTLTVNQPPAITSANTATLSVGTAGSFTVTATGTPIPTLTETGALPSGVTFVNNGNRTATLSGTPAAGTGGTYAITITASNGVGTAATQSFTLTINQAPAITSAASTTFTVSTAGSFTVTATGTPIPTLTETGALPSGVTFVNNGNRTATLSGTPAAGAAGTYPITITASNGVGTAATQSFTLTVAAAGSGPSNFAYVTGSVTGAFSFTGSSTTLAVPLHQSPGAGHLLVCAATWQSTTATASMADPNNGAWTAVGAAKTGTGNLSAYRGQMFYTRAAAGAATTVTLTLSASVAFRAFECAEYSYTGTISALDGTPQYSTTKAASSTATISGLTTVTSNDLVVAGCLAVDSTCTAGTGYTGRDDTNAFDAGANAFGSSFVGRTGQMLEDKANVAAGAQSATFHTGTTDDVILGLLAF